MVLLPVFSSLHLFAGGQPMAGMETHSRGRVPAEALDFFTQGTCQGFEPNLPMEDAESCKDVETAIRTEQWEKALEITEKLANRLPGSGLGFFWEGLIEMKRGNSMAGLKHLEAAAEKAPELPLAHLNLGVAYAMTRKTQLLRNQMRWVMANQPQSPWPYYYLGRYESEVLGELEQGTELFKEALKRNPQDYRSHNHIGLNYELGGDLEKAQVSYQAAISTADSQGVTFVYPLLGLSRVFRRQQNSPRAIQAARDAVSQDPGMVDSHLTLGSLYLQTGEPENAVPSLKTAAALNPGDPRPHYMLARAYRKMGFLSDARREEEIFTHLREPNPKNFPG